MTDHEDYLISDVSCPDRTRGDLAVSAIPQATKPNMPAGTIHKDITSNNNTYLPSIIHPKPPTPK